MKKKRILFLSSIFPPEAGGPAAYSENLLKVLSKKIDVALISSYSDRKKNLKVYDFLHYQFKGSFLNRAFIFFVKTLNQLPGSKVVFSMTSPQDTFLALIIARLFGKKSFMRVGGRYSLEQKNIYKKYFVLSLMKFLKLTGVDFISVSPSITGYLKTLGIKPIIELQNPFFEIKDKNNIKFKKEEKIRLITVSRLTSIKNISEILSLIKRIENTMFTIAGDGPLENSLKEEVKTLGIEDRVVFRGYLEGKELDHIYNDAHFYITASDFEGSPNSIIKALGHNLPVIAPASILRTDVIDSENAFVFNQISEAYNLIDNMTSEKYQEIKKRTQLKEENRLLNHIIRLTRTLQD